MTGPKTYVHKPTRADIWQFTLEDAPAIVRWMAHGGGVFDMSDDLSYVRIETRQGDSRDCHIGDSIVKRPAPTPSGFEFYPVEADVMDDYDEVTDAAHAPAGVAMCGADCIHGGYCTAPAGHDGDHATYARGGLAYCHWPQDGAS